MHSRTILGTGIALLALTACSGGGEPDAGVTATVTETVTAPAEDAVDKADSKAGDGLLKVGQSATLKDEDGVVTKATVYAYTHVEKGPEPPETYGGDAWATVDVKVCNVTGDITVSQFPWSLKFPDDTRTEVSGDSGGDLPRPEFPTDDVAVKAGDCVRGKIPFPVKSSKRPDRIIYAPDGHDPVEWSVPKG